MRAVVVGVARVALVVVIVMSVVMNFVSVLMFMSVGVIAARVRRGKRCVTDIVRTVLIVVRVFSGVVHTTL